MKFRSSSSVNKVIIAILLNVIVFAFLLLLFYEVRKKNQQISLVQNEIEFESKKIDRLKKLQQLVESTATDREKLEEYFLDEDEVVEFISQVEQLGKDAGSQIELSEVREEEVKGESYVYLVMNISTVGTWDQLIKYATLLENMPFIILLNNYTLNRNSEAEGKKDAIWSSRVTLRVLMMKSK